MSVIEHRLHDSTIALWQSLIDQMKGQAALGIMNEAMAIMFERGAEIARKINRLDFAARNVIMDPSGFITSTTHLLCEGCGYDQLLVPQEGDLSGDAICPACGIVHGTFQDVHAFAGFLTQVVYHYGEPEQFLPPLTAEERIGALIKIDGVPAMSNAPPHACKIE